MSFSPVKPAFLEFELLKLGDLVTGHPPTELKAVPRNELPWGLLLSLR